MPASVIVVEDEPLLRSLYVRTLADAGFDVVGLPDVAACRARLREHRADVVMLDLGLPGIDGMSFARELRAGQSDVGLLIVSRRNAPEDRIEALHLGCDDYLVKPVHLGELCARVQAVARRRSPRRRRHFGAVTLDLDARTVMAGDREIRLTRGEFTILALLGEADGRVVARDRLSAAVSRQGEDGDLRTVDALVRRIRRKLEALAGDVILTVPGLGYRIAAPALDG